VVNITRMKNCALSFFFQMLLFSAAAQSTDLIFRHLNRASGLPVDAVTCLAQDSTGFIWMGSREGLFRYDGFGFKSFYHQPGNSNTIPNNVISKICIDREGLLWVGTDEGLIVMKNNGELLRVFTSETDRQFSKETEKIRDIHLSGDLMWVTTSDGLLSISKMQDHSFRVQTHNLKKEFNFSLNAFGRFIIDGEKKLWICTNSGLIIFDPEKNSMSHASNNPLSLKLLDDHAVFNNVYFDKKKNKVYYTTWEPSEKIYDFQSNKVTTVYNGKGTAHPNYDWLTSDYLEDNHGTLWIGSGKGIKMITGTNEQVIEYRAGNSYGLADHIVVAMLMDKEENLWVATSTGISITRPYKQSLVNLSVNSAEKFAFAKWNVNTIIPVDSNTVLIGGNGIYRTDASFQVQEHYYFGTSDYDWTWTYYRLGDSILISTQKGNLLYHVSSKKLEKLTAPPFDKFFPIFSFASGNNGSIWMSRYYNDFLRFDPKTKKHKQYSLTQLGEPYTVLKLTENSDHTIWLLSSLSGILKFDPASEKITDRLPLNQKNGLLDTHIIFALEFGEELLIGYMSHGISVYNKRTKTFQHFSHANGLASNSVMDILKTDDHTAWIATRNGISRFDLITKTFLTYGFENGILQNDFSCITQLADGRLAAGSKGMVYFSPDQIKTAQQVRDPMITSINVYGDNIPVDSSNGSQPIHIAYDKNYFSVEYLSIQYTNNQQIEYAYKLEGFDKNWINAGNRRFVSYSNLPGGNYTLKLRARLPGTNWVETSTAMSIRVATPFFRKWWFVPLCALVFLALAYALFRYRVRQLVKVEKMRQSISSDLHDEVGASLTSISIFSEMARKSLASQATADNYLKRIGERSRDSIEKMGDIIWSINPDHDSMQQLLERMKTFVNETVEGKDVAIHWQQSEVIQSLKLEMVQRKNFYLIFKEAFINAVKYAQAKKIFIEFSVQHNKVFLKIRDDGKGFSDEAIRPGNGIKNIKHRATQLGGKAIITSNPGEGTSIAVQFPY